MLPKWIRPGYRTFRDKYFSVITVRDRKYKYHLLSGIYDSKDSARARALSVIEKYMNMNANDMFWKLARAAKAANVLTDDEIKYLSQYGTRKARYYDRHLFNLCQVLKDRRIPDELKELFKQICKEVR